MKLQTFGASPIAFLKSMKLTNEGILLCGTQVHLIKVSCFNYSLNFAIFNLSHQIDRNAIQQFVQFCNICIPYGSKNLFHKIWSCAKHIRQEYTALCGIMTCYGASSYLGIQCFFIYSNFRALDKKIQASSQSNLSKCF